MRPILLLALLLAAPCVAEESSSQLQLEERIIAEQQKNLQLKHELDLTANFDKQSASVSAVRSSLKVRADHGASNVDGATITTTPLAWKVHDAGKRGIAWGKPSSATAQPEREGRIAWDHVAPAEGVADDIDFPTPSSAKSRSLSWPGNQERLKQPAARSAVTDDKYHLAMKQVEQARQKMERRVSQEEFALDREAQADERNAREAGHAAAVRNVERVRRGILNKLAGEEQHLDAEARAKEASIQRREAQTAKLRQQASPAPARESLRQALEDSKSARQAALHRHADKHVLMQQDEQKQDDGSSQAKASVVHEHHDHTVWDPKVAAELRAKDGVWPIKWEKIEKQVRHLVSLVSAAEHPPAPKQEAPTNTALSDAETGEDGGDEGQLVDYTEGGNYKEDEDGVPWPLHERLEEAAKNPSVGMQWKNRDVDWPDSQPAPTDPNAEVKWDEADDLRDPSMSHIRHSSHSVFPSSSSSRRDQDDDDGRWRVSITPPDTVSDGEYGWPRDGSSAAGDGASGHWFSSRRPSSEGNDDESSQWWMRGQSEWAKLKAVPMSPGMVMAVFMLMCFLLGWAVGVNCSYCNDLINQRGPLLTPRGGREEPPAVSNAAMPPQHDGTDARSQRSALSEKPASVRSGVTQGAMTISSFDPKPRLSPRDRDSDSGIPGRSPRGNQDAGQVTEVGLAKGGPGIVYSTRSVPPHDYV